MMVVVLMVIIMVMMEMSNDADSSSDGSPNSSSGPWRRLAFLFYLIILFLQYRGLSIGSHACYTNTLYPMHGGWAGRRGSRGVNACTGTHICVHTC